MNEPDTAIVYFNPANIANKKLEPITEEQVNAAFNRKNLMVFTDSQKLKDYLQSLDWKHKNLLMMSSGNFDGINFEKIIEGYL